MMPDNDEPILQALTGFASQVWGYNEDKARMAAEILWQCRKPILAGGVAGGLFGAEAGFGVLSIPGWAVGAFGGIVLGAMTCSGVKGPGAMGMHEILRSSQRSTPILDMNLLVAQHRGDMRLQQKMDMLLNLNAGRSQMS